MTTITATLSLFRKLMTASRAVQRSGFSTRAGVNDAFRCGSACTIGISGLASFQATIQKGSIKMISTF